MNEQQKKIVQVLFWLQQGNLSDQTMSDLGDEIFERSRKN